MDDTTRLKQRAAEAALAYVNDSEIIGVGTGSTVNHFIELLGSHHPGIRAVSSSRATSERLQAVGIRVEELNDAGTLSVYVDGADQANTHGQLIKGGGAALTREKIIAGASRRFVCIIDQSKLVDLLGTFPLPVEVIPMARSFVARELVALGGHPQWRQNITTDNGNIIVDAHHLEMLNPVSLEDTIDRIPGVVTVGLFARRPADVLLVAGEQGVRKFENR